jgi:hypothetical protein
MAARLWDVLGPKSPTKENTAERAGMAVAEFQDRCLKPLGHPSSLATSTTDALALADKVDIAGASP